MLSFPKKNFRFIAVLILGLVLPAFLCPFYYFLPENSPNQVSQVNVFEQQTHFHSEVLEAYVHFISHPSDPEQDKKYHQTHSSRNHVKDYIDFCGVQKNFTPLKSTFIVKTIDCPKYFEVPRVLISYRGKSEIPTFTSLKIPRIQSSRSPPLLSI
jgi:hypothetical protein